ncbi:MAG: tat (twin-arginine translocation) pathway signal sequence, partial [Bacteroidota bacterium]
MKRRDFLKRGISVGFIAGTAFTMNPLKLRAGSNSGNYDMVAIRGGSAASMFDRAIEEYGGMS